jgi:hypothetical protein
MIPKNAFFAAGEVSPGVSKDWGRGLRSMTRGDLLLGD